MEPNHIFIWTGADLSHNWLEAGRCKAQGAGVRGLWCVGPELCYLPGPWINLLSYFERAGLLNSQKKDNDTVISNNFTALVINEIKLAKLIYYHFSKNRFK